MKESFVIISNVGFYGFMVFGGVLLLVVYLEKRGKKINPFVAFGGFGVLAILLLIHVAKLFAGVFFL